MQKILLVIAVNGHYTDVCKLFRLEVRPYPSDRTVTFHLLPNLVEFQQLCGEVRHTVCRSSSHFKMLYKAGSSYLPMVARGACVFELTGNSYLGNSSGS